MQVLTEKPPSILKPATTTAANPKIVTDPTFTRPCDLKTDLYVLQPERLNSSTPLKVVTTLCRGGHESINRLLTWFSQGKLTNCHSSGCERPFSVQKIPHSNLILLVVDTLCPCGSKQLDISPQEAPGIPGKEHLFSSKRREFTYLHFPSFLFLRCMRSTTIS